MTSSSPSASLHRVAITGAGVVSPLGIGCRETLEALRNGKDAIGPVTGFDASGCRSRTAGEVDEGRLREAETAADRKGSRRHRSSRMLVAATREALSFDPDFRPEVMVIGTTSGGMSFGEAFFRSLATAAPAGQRRQRPAWLANYAPQKALVDAQAALGFCGVPCQIIANACASGTNALGHAFQLIRHGVRTRVLAGGYDAISELVFVGFDSLQASTPERCRPFDRDRSGLVLGEGAAVMTLEAWDTATARGARILGEITGYGLSTDNHHLTQPHPSGVGPRQAMERALEQAGNPRIDYINAHGTATPFNDATEGAAIEALFGPGGVPVSSTKAMMGHSLGAAGAVEAVFSLLALEHQFLPPNLNYREPDPQWTLDVVVSGVRTTRDARVERVLSNSFGFGGTNASLILQHPEVIS